MKTFISLIVFATCIFSAESFAKKVQSRVVTADQLTHVCDGSSVGWSYQAQIRKAGYRMVSVDGVIHYNHSVVFVPTADERLELAYIWLPGEDIRQMANHAVKCASPFPPKDRTPPYYPDTYKNRN